jgi:hypothetical protein
LPVGWRIEQNESRRVLTLDDLPIMVIDYGAAPNREQSIELTNLRYSYRLKIDSVAAGSAP